MAHALEFAYDARGQLESVRDPDDGLTYYEYDAVGRTRKVDNRRHPVRRASSSRWAAMRHGPVQQQQRRRLPA